MSDSGYVAALERLNEAQKREIETLRAKVTELDNVLDHAALTYEATKLKLEERTQELFDLRSKR